MTFIEAGIEILKQFDVPMTSSEIWSEITKQKLMDSNGKTPIATLYSVLLVYSDNNTKFIKTKLRKQKLITIVEENPYKFMCIKQEVVENEVVENEVVEKEPFFECVLNNNTTKLIIYNENETLNYVTSEIKSFTYFIKDTVSNNIKIGRTNDIFTRMSAFKTSNPHLILELIIPHANNEKILHKKFEKFRGDGEWFFPVKDIIKFIENEKIKKEKAINSYNMFMASKNLENIFLSHF